MFGFCFNLPVICPVWMDIIVMPWSFQGTTLMNVEVWFRNEQQCRLLLSKQIQVSICFMILTTHFLHLFTSTTHWHSYPPWAVFSHHGHHGAPWVNFFAAYSLVLILTTASSSNGCLYALFVVFSFNCCCCFYFFFVLVFFLSSSFLAFYA